MHTLSAYHSDLSVVAAGLANLSSDTAAGGSKLRLQMICVRSFCGIEGPDRPHNCQRLSTLRHFMSWMVAENHRADNPSQFLDNPKLPRIKSLSEDEVIA